MQCFLESLLSAPNLGRGEHQLMRFGRNGICSLNQAIEQRIKSPDLFTQKNAARYRALKSGSVSNRYHKQPRLID
jgi:hypothetical protein